MSRDILRGVRPKESQQLMRRLVKEGWTVSTTGRNHVKLTHPNGRSVVTGLTGSSYNGWKKFERNVRNIEEGRPTS
jgi:predicted RNA binding protein YcfA (HicA-like mRNA interferase family)